MSQQPRYFRDGSWLISARLLTMAIGMLGLPILMSALGPLQFGALAVLMGGTVAFGTLELGMSAAVLRWAALSNSPSASTVISNALVCSAGVFLLAGIALIPITDPIAALLNLPDTPLLSPGQCILLIYATVSLTGLLRIFLAMMMAYRRFGSYVGATLTQAVFAAAVTWPVALWTQRLDLVLIANSVAILSVQLGSALWFSRLHPWRFSGRDVSITTMRKMLRHGTALQFSDLSTFFMFQFDKLVIAAVVNPAEVSHYEVAGRATQALGSLPFTSFQAAIPDLIERTGHDPVKAREELARQSRFIFMGVALFLILPAAVAPIGLFAWVGQIGHQATGVFYLLMAAVACNAMLLPVTTYLQAVGQVRFEMQRAMSAALINIPLSLILIHHYGKEGAALGTFFAILIANLVFLTQMRNRFAVDLGSIGAALRPILIATIWVSIALIVATRIIEPLVITSRWRMAPAAVLLYLLGLVGLLALLVRRNLLSEEERVRLLNIPILRNLLQRLRGRTPR